MSDEEVTCGEQRQTMPLLTRNEYPNIRFEYYVPAGFVSDNPSERLAEWGDSLVKIQRDADLKVLEAQRRAWREEEADWLDKWWSSLSSSGTYSADLKAHIAELRKEGNALADISKMMAQHGTKQNA